MEEQQSLQRTQEANKTRTWIKEIIRIFKRYLENKTFTNLNKRLEKVLTYTSNGEEAVIPVNLRRQIEVTTSELKDLQDQIKQAQVYLQLDPNNTTVQLLLEEISKITNCQE